MRESREPRLSDLRESGSIEQDADLVMFLWREKERGAEDQSADGEVVKLKLSKHRNGPTGEIDLWFRKAQTRFVNYAGDRFADVGSAAVQARCLGLVGQQGPDHQRVGLAVGPGRHVDPALRRRSRGRSTPSAASSSGVITRVPCWSAFGSSGNVKSSIVSRGHGQARTGAPAPPLASVSTAR